LLALTRLLLSRYAPGDVDHDGLIDFGEFCDLMAKQGVGGLFRKAVERLIKAKPQGAGAGAGASHGGALFDSTGTTKAAKVQGRCEGGVGMVSRSGGGGDSAVAARARIGERGYSDP